MIKIVVEDIPYTEYKVVSIYCNDIFVGNIKTHKVKYTNNGVALRDKENNLIALLIVDNVIYN